jgi:uncharacterized protein
MQHQFWDLIITDHTFEVGLSFSGVPERLLIPFDALTGFFDPSVQFGLKFDSQEGDEDEESTQAPVPPETRNGSDPVALKTPRKSAGADKPGGADKKADPKKPPRTAPEPAAASDDDQSAKEPPAGEADAVGSAQVVSLDAFRKKN